MRREAGAVRKQLRASDRDILEECPRYTILLPWPVTGLMSVIEWETPMVPPKMLFDVLPPMPPSA